MTEEKTKYAVSNNKVYMAVATDFYRMWKLCDVPYIADLEKIDWIRNKVPWELWQKIVSFLHWTYDRDKDEGLVYLYYNPETDEWDAWAPPQKGVGMTVHSLPGDEYDKQRKQWPEPWFECGSIHHHNGGSAFHSGTDDKDEDKREGVHITLGKMDEEEFEEDTRCVFGDTWSESSLEAWVLPPECVRHLPEKYYHSVASDMLLDKSILVDYALIPEQWKKNFCMGTAREVEGDPEVEKIKTSLKYSGTTTYPSQQQQWWEQQQNEHNKSRSKKKLDLQQAVKRYLPGIVRIKNKEKEEASLADVGINSLDILPELKRIIPTEWRLYQIYSLCWLIANNMEANKPDSLLDDLDKICDALTPMLSKKIDLFYNGFTDELEVWPQDLIDTNEELEYLNVSQLFKEKSDSLSTKLEGLKHLGPLKRKVVSFILVEVLSHHSMAVEELEDNGNFNLTELLNT